MAKRSYEFLERFNNYFNRKIIKLDTRKDYEKEAQNSYIPVDSNGRPLPFDFNPNDNITTEIIVNDVPFEPDYFLLLDEAENIVSRWFVLEQKRNRQGQWLYQLKRDVIADNLNNLLEAPIFVQKGMLKEDDPFIVNDEGMSLNQIKQSELPIFDRSKTAWIIGYMAKNAGGSDINVQVDAETVNIDYKTLGEIASAIGTTEGVLNGFINTDGGTTNRGYFTTSISMRVFATYLDTDGYYSANTPYSYTFTPDFSSGNGSMGTSYSSSMPYLFISTLGNNQNNMTEPFKQAVIDKQSLWRSQISSMLGKSYFLTQDQLNDLWAFNGSIIKYNGKYYTLTISELGNHATTKNRIKKDGTYSALEETCSKTVELVGTSIQPFRASDYNPLYSDAGQLDTLTSNEKEVAISLNLISDSDLIPQLNTTVSSGRKVTSGQEYDAFAIPLSIDVNDSTDFVAQENYARRIASAIVREENAKVYDLQLLPYCPLPSLIKNDGEIDITNLTEHTDFDYIFKNVSDRYFVYKEKADITFTPSGVGTWSASVSLTMVVPAGKTGTVVEITASGGTSVSISNISSSQAGNNVTVTFDYEGPDPSLPDSPNVIVDVYYTYPEDNVKCGIMFYLSTSTFETSISTSFLNPYWNDQFNKSKKTISNCFMCRLVSPNYQGTFEFNVAKNGGKIDYFNIYCTYKPYTPVIKVAPNFNWLYGYEFKDNRGLICAGDFSLPRLTDEWRTYELNNKNYQNIFNRDIQHLEFTQSIEMRNQLVSGGVNILSDVAKGAGAGAMLGGGWGAVAGAVIGGGLSGVGYGIDVDTMARVHRENKQLAIDKFNYQLGNIKALPYTLTKVGSFDVISKIFPFIEVYSCSEQELKAFEDKIKYESMTVMRIGTLEEFMNFDDDIHYFKGALIRNDEIADDNHVLNVIYEELLKGVYI